MYGGGWLSDTTFVVRWEAGQWGYGRGEPIKATASVRLCTPSRA